MSKVLIVDDNLDNCQMLARLVHHTGHEGQYVMSGQEALPQIVNDPPSVVLLDVMMPDMSGFDVLRAIQQQSPQPEVPVIMFSACSDPEQMELARELGAKDYLVKGRTTFAELLELVQKYAGEIH